MAGWKIDHLKMYFLLKSGEMGIFHCHVSLLESKSWKHQFSGAISVSVAWKNGSPACAVFVSSCATGPQMAGRGDCNNEGTNKKLRRKIGKIC